mgnify:CR=1 FL=1
MGFAKEILLFAQAGHKQQCFLAKIRSLTSQGMNNNNNMNWQNHLKLLYTLKK